MSQANQSGAEFSGCEFRAMDPTARNRDGAGVGADNCSVFKPMFNRWSSQDSENSQGSNGNEEEMLDQAREKGWLEGMASGCEDACRTAREELSPAMNAFFAAWDELVQSSEQGETQATDTIVTLSFAIARRILGEKVTLSGRDTAPLKAVLVQHIASANRLILKMNPDDLASLQAFACSDRQAWPDHSAVIIQPDEALSPGTFEIASQKGSRTLMDQNIIKEVMALLAEQALLPA